MYGSGFRVYGYSLYALKGVKSTLHLQMCAFLSGVGRGYGLRCPEVGRHSKKPRQPARYPSTKDVFFAGGFRAWDLRLLKRSSHNLNGGTFLEEYVLGPGQAPP